jgi:hypothetical protein
MPTPEAIDLVGRIRARYKAPGNEHELELTEAAEEIDRFAAQRGAEVPQMPLSEACLRGGCQYGPSSGGPQTGGGDAPGAPLSEIPDHVLNDCGPVEYDRVGGGDAGERASPYKSGREIVDALAGLTGEPDEIVCQESALIAEIDAALRSSRREGAEAMRAFADQLEKIAFSMRPPNAYTPQLAMLANALRAYAVPGKTDAG